MYGDLRWQRTRAAVLERDQRRCQACGRHEHDLDEGECLVADHWPDGVLDVADPFDVGACRTLCSTCSGREDGRQGAGF